MINDIKILKIIRLFILIPAMLMLFACTGEEEVSSVLNITGVEQTEEVLELKHRECWQADVVAMIYDTTGKLVMGMYGQLTQGALAFMMVAFAIWLAFRILKHIGSFTEESPAEVWTEITRKFFICFVCGLLASSPQGSLFILNSILFPVYNAFLEFGGEIVSRASDTDAQMRQHVEALQSSEDGQESLTTQDIRGKVIDSSFFKGDKGKMVTAQYDSVCTVQGVNRAAVASSFTGGVDTGFVANMSTEQVRTFLDKASLEAFPETPKRMMECMICSVSERLNIGWILGFKILGGRGFMALVCGLGIMAVFWFVKLAFVFYLIDSLFRFAMMVFILPLLIMAFAFKGTKKIAVTGFLTIINSGAFMMSIAIIIFIGIAAIQQIIFDNRMLFNFWRPGAATDEFSDYTAPFIMLMLIGFLMVGSIGVAKEIVDSLVGGGGEANVQKRVALVFAMAAKWAWKKATFGIGNFALRHSKKLRDFQKKKKAFDAKIDSLSGKKSGGKNK